MLRPGLDGASDTVSLEAVAKPGHFITAYAPGRAGTDDTVVCKDVLVSASAPTGLRVRWGVALWGSATEAGGRRVRHTPVGAACAPCS
jgi:hypothetical protein